MKNLVKNGYKEIWLLGENVNSYKSQLPLNSKGITRGEATGSNPNTQIPVNFAKLLRIINDIPGNFWVRFTSSHPKDFSDELIKTIAECEKITKYISLPVQ